MVSLDGIRTVMGILGNVIALGLFLSPVPTFYRIWKRGSVEQFSVVPYLATLLNCMLWIVYGLPMVKPHSTLVLTINGAGLAIELAYVVLFVLYSDGRRRLWVLAALLVEVAFVCTVAVLVLMLAHTEQRRVLIVGVLCVLFGTVMYAAPLSVMKLVIKTKSVEYMPFFLSLVSFFNSLCWTTYALIRLDLFITVPNILGVLFATAQLLLHAIYYKSTKRQIEQRESLQRNGIAEAVTVGENNETSRVHQNDNI